MRQKVRFAGGNVPQGCSTDFANFANGRRSGAGPYGPFYTLAPDLYPPDIMARAAALLQQAQSQAAGDPLALARVEWLAKGFHQSELILATQRAYEHAIDTRDYTALRPAYQALVDFRQENAEYDRQNFAGLTTAAERMWKGLK